MDACLAHKELRIKKEFTATLSSHNKKRINCKCLSGTCYNQQTTESHYNFNWKVTHKMHTIPLRVELQICKQQNRMGPYILHFTANRTAICQIFFSIFELTLSWRNCKTFQRIFKEVFIGTCSLCIFKIILFMKIICLLQ